MLFRTPFPHREPPSTRPSCQLPPSGGPAQTRRLASGRWLTCPLLASAGRSFSGPPGL